jgi:mannose-6-phosphate isomerase-like protein (cupin superfamily)
MRTSALVWRPFSDCPHVPLVTGGPTVDIGESEATRATTAAAGIDRLWRQPTVTAGEQQLPLGAAVLVSALVVPVGGWRCLVRRAESGEGLRREARGSEMWFKATATDTQGRFSLMERTLPPGGRMPPPHSHVGNEEAYFVLDGAVEFRVADDVFEGTSGTFVLVPAGEAHTFGNTGDEPARLLVLHVPALDGYFEDLEKLWASPEPPDRETELALMRRHGMEPA